MRNGDGVVVNAVSSFILFVSLILLVSVVSDYVVGVGVGGVMCVCASSCMLMGIVSDTGCELPVDIPTFLYFSPFSIVLFSTIVRNAGIECFCLLSCNSSLFFSGLLSYYRGFHCFCLLRLSVGSFVCWSIA